MISPFQAVLIGLIYFAANTSFLGGLAYFTIWRPLINGLLVGLVLGNPLTGLYTGAFVNVLYLGYMSVGGTLGIGDAALAGILGATLSITFAPASPVNAIGVGVIFGVLLGNIGFPLLTLRMRLDNRIVHHMEQAALRGDTRGLMRWNILGGQGLLLLITLPSAAIIAYSSLLILNLAFPYVPAWAWHGLGLSGTSLASALGIALALRFVFKRYGILSFFAGFLLQVGLGISSAGLSLAILIGGALALMTHRILNAGIILPHPVRKQPASGNGLYRNSTLEHSIETAPPPIARGAQKPGQTPPVRSWTTFALWQFFSHSSYSFERMQGSGVACALAPALAQLYPNASERALALQCNLSFFNVEPNWGSILIGVLLRLEQERADDEQIHTTKQTLMGTMSGFGDTVSQGAILPLVLSIGLGLSLNSIGSLSPIWGAVIYLGIICPLMVLISCISFHVGYTRGRDGALAILANPLLKSSVSVAEWMSAFTLGGLAALPAITGLHLVHMGQAIDVWLNYAITFALVMALFWLTQWLHIKPVWVLLGLVVAGVLLAALGAA